MKDEANERFFEMPKVCAQGSAEVDRGTQHRRTLGRDRVEDGGSVPRPERPGVHHEASINQPRWLFRVEPTVLKTWEGTGWAKRYWVENDKTLSYEEAHGLSESSNLSHARCPSNNCST